MAERPILFSAPMVRAILAGRKTQTRRLYKPRYPAPYEFLEDGVPFQTDEYGDSHRRLDPFGEPGDRLWVRETWQYADWTEDGYPFVGYQADGTRKLCENHGSEWSEKLSDIWSKLSEPANFSIDNRAADRRWRPSIFLPRWASRLTLQVTKLGVQRLHDISEDDALDEGVYGLTINGATYGDAVGCQHQPTTCARCVYALLWDSLHGFNAWNKNPWVWAISFCRPTPEERSEPHGKER